MLYDELIQRPALQTLLFSCFVQKALLKPHFPLFNEPMTMMVVLMEEMMMMMMMMAINVNIRTKATFALHHYASCECLFALLSMHF